MYNEVIFNVNLRCYMSSLGTPANLLRCPVCQNTLKPIASGVVCVNRHQFDRAREGYINLLLGHKKRSCNPGDNKAMVKARTQFLLTGNYASIADSLTAKAAEISANIDKPVIIDAGCGEGYFTNKIKQLYSFSEILGFDISKPAIQACSVNHRSIHWVVASVNDIPIINNKVDIIISAFSRCDWKEFARVLKPQGSILILSPGSGHLQSLREVIYKHVRPYVSGKELQNMPSCFSVRSTQYLKGEMNLDNTETIMNLLIMTPHYWRINDTQKKRLLELDSLICSYDIQLTNIQFNSNDDGREGF